MNQQYIINKVLNNIHMQNEFMYGLVDKNVMTRGSQEPNLLFPMEATVQWSLIQCSQQLCKT